MHSFHFWCFNDERDVGKARVVEDIREGGRTDIPLTDVFVPVHPGFDRSISRH